MSNENNTERVDYFSGTPFFVWLKGFVVVEYETSGMVLIAKEGHGPLDGVSFRVNEGNIRPTTEHHADIRARQANMAKDRIRVKRAAFDAGFKFRNDAPIRFTQFGAWIETIGETFIRHPST